MNASPYIRTAPERSSPAIDYRGVGECALVFLVVVTASGALYKFGIATLAWALIYAVTLVVVVRDHAQVLKSAAIAWPLLCFPLFCLISVFWSVEPHDSLRHAAQYLFTAALATWIGSIVAPERLLRAVGIGLFACAAFSVLATYLNIISGVRQGDYAGAERYFVGLFTQKNVFGNAIVLATIGLLTLGAHTGHKWRYALAALALAPVLYLTKSTTAAILYVGVWSYWPALHFIRHQRHKTAVFLGALTGGLLLSTVFIAVDFSPVSEVLGALGKDTTLTGRTLIWDMGFDLYLQHPVTGIGYQAFWESPAYTSDVMLIRAAVLESIGGFHNGYLEAMVATGLPGVLLYALLVTAPLIVCWNALMREPTALRLGALYICLLIASRTFTESSVFYQHDLDFILLVAIGVASARSLHPTKVKSSYV
ncbi:MAG: O-antigen ligase family protein [Gammaproteobacteria bacterium]